jgi:ribosomal protein L37E
VTVPLAEHFADGRARYLIEVGADPIALHRPLPTVAKSIPSLHDDAGWIAAGVACLDCGLAWAAIAPVPADARALECLRCGSMSSAPIEDAWCSACGHEHRVAQPEGAPRDRGECPVCHAMAVFVQDAA